MHEANFRLIGNPHVRQSGKNSADIRLVVDALDLCYTKSHGHLSSSSAAILISRPWCPNCGKTPNGSSASA